MIATDQTAVICFASARGRRLARLGRLSPAMVMAAARELLAHLDAAMRKE